MGSPPDDLVGCGLLAVTVVPPLSFSEVLVLLLNRFRNTFCTYCPVLWASQELNYSHMNLHGEKCDQHMLLLKLPTNIGGLTQWLMRAKRIEWIIPTLICSHEDEENDTFSFWAQRAQERMEMLNAANIRTLQCVIVQSIILEKEVQLYALGSHSRRCFSSFSFPNELAIVNPYQAR